MQRAQGPSGVVVRRRVVDIVILRVEQHVRHAAVRLIHAHHVAAGGKLPLAPILPHRNFGVARESLHLDALHAQQVDHLRALRGTGIAARNHPCRRSFILGLVHTPLALQIKVSEKLLAIGRHVVHREQESALLEIDVVAERPVHTGQRRIGPVPGPAGGIPRHGAFAGIRADAAKRLIEPSDGVVPVGHVEHVVRRPSVVVPVRPHARHAALGHLLDFYVRHFLPLVDHQRIQPRIVRAHAGGYVEERLRFVQIVQHRGVVLEERAHHGPAQRQRHAQRIPIVVVRHVLAPVDLVGRRLAGVGLPIVVHVHGAVAAIGFGDRRDQHDRILADVLDQRRLFHRQPVRQFHQHLGRAGLGRMDAARGPIERQRFGDRLVRLRLRRPARVRQPGGEFFVMVQPGNVALVRNRHQDDFAAFLRVADGKHLDPLGGLFQLPQVAVDILRISELVGRADGVSQHLLRRGHAIGSGQVVHQLRQEKRLRGVLADFGGVPLVISPRRGSRNRRRRFGGLLVGGRKRQGD